MNNVLRSGKLFTPENVGSFYRREARSGREAVGGGGGRVDRYWYNNVQHFGYTVSTCESVVAYGFPNKTLRGNAYLPILYAEPRVGWNPLITFTVLPS